MMLGEISDKAVPILVLEAKSERGPSRFVSFVVDTGFTGMLSVPTAEFEKLRIGPVDIGPYELANEQRGAARRSFAKVVWHGCDETVEIMELAGVPLLGMSMLHGSTLYVDAVEGGRVEIKPRDAAGNGT